MNPFMMSNTYEKGRSFRPETRIGKDLSHKKRNLMVGKQLRPSRKTGQEHSFFGTSCAKGMDHEP